MAEYEDWWDDPEFMDALENDEEFAEKFIRTQNILSSIEFVGQVLSDTIDTAEEVHEAAKEDPKGCLIGFAGYILINVILMVVFGAIFLIVAALCK